MTPRIHFKAFENLRAMPIQRSIRESQLKSRFHAQATGHVFNDGWWDLDASPKSTNRLKKL
jgi:hypothetical protein